jgi:hypothetical protein
MTKRTAVVRTRSFKLSWVMSPERIPRDLLSPDGTPGDCEWQLKLADNAPPITARFTANDYQRMLREIDAQQGGAMITLQGYLNGCPAGLVLEKTSFKVDRRRGPPPTPKSPEPKP